MFPVWWKRPDKIEKLANKTPEEYKRLHAIAVKKYDKKRTIAKKLKSEQEEFEQEQK